MALNQATPLERSLAASAKAKKSIKTTPEGLPIHSFQTLLGHLATETRTRCASATPMPPTTSTPSQHRYSRKHSNCSVCSQKPNTAFDEQLKHFKAIALKSLRNFGLDNLVDSKPFQVYSPVKSYRGSTVLRKHHGTLLERQSYGNNC